MLCFNVYYYTKTQQPISCQVPSYPQIINIFWSRMYNLTQTTTGSIWYTLMI